MRWGQAERLWRKWDAALAAGEKPQDFLEDVSDESLIQLLLVCPADKQRDRDTIATHLWNRLRWSRQTLAAVTEEADAAIRGVTETIERAAPVIHRLERIGLDQAAPGPDPANRRTAISSHEASLMIEAVRDAHRQAREALDRLETFRAERVGMARGEPE